MRIAIVGIGKIATTQYLPYLAAMEDVELGYWNRNPAPAIAAVSRFGGRHLVSLHDVAAYAPDLVFVLTSEHARLRVATELVNLGVRDLFLEKPLGAREGQANVSEADYGEAVVFARLCESAGATAAINFNYRSFATTQRALEWQRTRSLGTIRSLSVAVHFACWSHTLDLIALFAGNPVRVAAIEGGVVREGKGLAARDLAVSFETANGASGTVFGSTGGPWDHSIVDMTMDFDGGRIRLWDLDGGVELLTEGNPYVESMTLGGDKSRWDRYSASFSSALDAHFAARAAGTNNAVPMIDGLQELRFEAAIRRAARTGQVVDVEKEFPF